MPGPDSSIKSPFPSWQSRYLPPADTHYLDFDLPDLQSQIGWAAQMQNGQVVNLNLDCGSGDFTDSLTGACAALSRGMNSRSSLDPKVLAPIFVKAGGTKLWDKLYDLAHDHGSDFWPDVPGTQKNILTKKPASVGQVDSEGNFVPTDPKDLIAGSSLPDFLSPTISLGKRFLFASHTDVHFYMYLDKDAFSANQVSRLVSGGGVGIEGTTSRGTQVKLRFGIGRDSTAGPAGFLTVHVGPDNLPQPQQP